MARIALRVCLRRAVWFVAGMRGSLASTAYLDCRVELTIRRTIWLEKL